MHSCNSGSLWAIGASLITYRNEGVSAVFHHNGSHQHRAPPGNHGVTRPRGPSPHAHWLPEGLPRSWRQACQSRMPFTLMHRWPSLWVTRISSRGTIQSWVGDAKDHRSRIYIIYIYIIWLVVEPTPLKNMTSSVGMMIIPNIWKNKKCSKPPTSIYIYNIMLLYIIIH